MNLPLRRPDAPRYTCTKCGCCCRWSGYVRLSPEEVDRIALFLGMSPAGFVEKYTDVTRDRPGLTLIERADGACILLEGDRLCTIYPVRPKQCRTFPNGWQFEGFEQQCQAIDTWSTTDEPD